MGVPSHPQTQRQMEQVVSKKWHYVRTKEKGEGGGSKKRKSSVQWIMENRVGTNHSKPRCRRGGPVVTLTNGAQKKEGVVREWKK